MSIKDICREAKITDYLKHKGVELIEVGRRVKCICPLPKHVEKTPSFVISTMDDGTQLFKCFGCDAGGNIVTLMKLMEGLSGKEIIKGLAKKTGIKIGIPEAKIPELPTIGLTEQADTFYHEDDCLVMEIASYVAELVSSKNGSLDIVNKICRLMKQIDKMAEEGDQEGLRQMYIRVRKFVHEYE